MEIETDGGCNEWQYGDKKTRDSVIRSLNQVEIQKHVSSILRDEADDLLEKVERNYLEPENQGDKGSKYPRAKDFADENSSDTRTIGTALSGLAEMPDQITEFDYWSKEDRAASRYDMSSTDPQRLCGVLEALTRVEDEDLDRFSTED